MQDFGADTEALDRAASRIAEGAERLRTTATLLEQASWQLTGRFSGLRGQASHEASRLRGRASHLNDLAWELRQNADAQRRVSGGDGRGMTAGGSGRARVLRGPNAVAAGIAAATVRRGRILGGRAGGLTAMYGEFARDTHKLVKDGAETAKLAIGLKRVVRPNTPGQVNLSRLRSISMKQVRASFREAPSNTGKLLRLKKTANAGSIGLVSGLVAGLFGANTWPKFGAEGVGQAATVWGAVTDASRVRQLAMAGKTAGKFATRAGGALAIIGGAIGLAGDYADWRNGSISGKRALGMGAIHGASVVGGVLMFTPAAPIGAAIVAGAAIVEAGVWLYDNRAKVAALAKGYGRAVAGVASVQIKAAQKAASVVRSAGSNFVKGGRAVLKRFRFG